MKFRINKDACVGCGACVSVCPTVFSTVDGKAVVIVDLVPAELQASALEAENICPVQAITHK